MRLLRFFLLIKYVPSYSRCCGFFTYNVYASIGSPDYPSKRNMNFRNLWILFVNPNFLVIVQHLYGCKLWRLTGSQEKIEKLRGAAEAPPAGWGQQNMAGGAGGRFRPFERSLSCYGFLQGRRKVRKSGGCTEVRRAPLIHFQKTFFRKGFLCIKISQIDQILCMDHYIG